MNFRDIAEALALYPVTPGRSSSATSRGRGEAIGAGVKHVAVGDRVFGIAVLASPHRLRRRD
jgi:hypothetical protein